MNLTSELVKSLSSTNVTSFQTLTSHLFWGSILFSKTAPKTDHLHGKANRGHLKVRSYYEFNLSLKHVVPRHLSNHLFSFSSNATWSKTLLFT
jgi:hypothetical protein